MNVLVWPAEVALKVTHWIGETIRRQPCDDISVFNTDAPVAVVVTCNGRYVGVIRIRLGITWLDVGGKTSTVASWLMYAVTMVTCHRLDEWGRGQKCP